jgi:basic membrane lipoprotein Med (substrate-binding protein (PBP1-ABC) superfamily)
VRVDLLIVQLAVIFLPGIIWARLDAGYAAKVKPTDVEFFLRAFLFGISTYAVEFLVFSAFGWSFSMADLADAATREVVSGQVLQSAWCCRSCGSTSRTTSC